MQNRIFSDIILYIFTDAGEDEFEEEEEDGLEDGKCWGCSLLMTWLKSCPPYLTVDVC